MDTEILAVAFGTAVGRLPMLILACVGLWFACLRRERLGRASFWATWGFALLIAYSVATYGFNLAYTLEQMNVIDLLGDGGASTRLDFMQRYGLLQSPIGLLYIAGLVFVTRAVFAGRFARHDSSAELPAHGAEKLRV